MMIYRILYIFNISLPTINHKIKMLKIHKSFGFE